MLSILRSLAVLVLATTVAAVLAEIVTGGDDRGVSATVTALVFTTVATAQLLAALSRRHAEAWGRRPPLWSRPSGRPAPPVPEGIRQWQALLVSATTGDRRARVRLERHLDRLSPVLGEPAPAVADLDPDGVLDAVEAMVDRMEAA